MRKALGISVAIAGVLLAAVMAEAKGPKTPIVVQTGSGVLEADVSVTLCEASSPLPCLGQTLTCPLIQVFGNDLIQKSSCGPAGFKVTNYEYNITINPTGGCFGSNTAGTETVCGSGSATVSLKVGH